MNVVIPARAAATVGISDGGFVTSRVLAYLGGFQRVGPGGGSGEAVP
ncbi:hypothetical protein [Jiangella ureilytica]|nr:hypothetical protein [Jiangella ureilytica]